MAWPAKKDLGSPLIYGYLKRFQEDPSSRVFAPLAEAYRKAGLLNEAIEIAREGLRVHPGFIGGRVALARALFDRKQYLEVLKELAQVVQDAPDNLAAQRLFADSALMSGQVGLALQGYKTLLYYAPQDSETARIVAELETEAYERGSLVLRTDPRGSTNFEIADASAVAVAAPAIPGRGPDVSLAKQAWMRKIELLQELLLRVDRYRGSVNRRPSSRPAD